MFRLILILLVTALCISGCATKSSFVRNDNDVQLKQKPENCLVDVFYSGKDVPKKEFIVIGDISVGGGDVINPRLTGCKGVGGVMLDAKKQVCIIGGDAIVNAILSDSTCASVFGQVVVYK